MNNTTSNNSTVDQLNTSEPTEERKVSNALNSLSPINDADKDGHYSTMLKWAVENRKEKDIKNIAITGPYGSGKSSILKTFEKNHGSEDLVFLNISLATFKEEDGAPASKIKGNKGGHDANSDVKETDKPQTSSPAEKQALLRLVELSILQQIFYHEKDDDIPDTRFKKTRSFSEESASELTTSIFLFLISSIYLLYSERIWKMFDISIPQSGRNLFSLIALCTVGWMGYQFIRKSIRPLRSVQLKKFNVQQAEFAVDDNISKSILNEHLDEILYFFEVTKYTIVVFEDLDRFEQTEIFTKLRELNHLINYSKKMNDRRVVFVYAVRDDMFQDKDRTKFFDFIIPIIPVINSSNSNVILRNVVNDNKYNINSDLIDNVAFFVDDMRLLFNIMNEYYLYHKKLDIKNQSKLLAMVVYKNIYPNDFVELSNGKGALFNALHCKATYVSHQLAQFEQKIAKHKADFKIVDNHIIKDEKELRKLYILEYLHRYPRALKFVINSVNYNFTEVLEKEVFQNFINGDVQYNYIDYGSEYREKISVSFSTIEKTVDPEFTYAQRIDIISGNRLEAIKEKIAEIEEKKDKLRHRTIQELLADDVIELDIKDRKLKQLISIMLRGGYIDENYLDYVSIFHEGAITKGDNEFLLNVRAHIKTEFGHPLHKINELIGKLTDTEFEREYVLNYNLLDYLFRTGYSEQRSKIFSTLGNESESSIAFIDGYLQQNSANERSFIAHLIKVWPEIWTYVSTKSVFTQERVAYYFNLIIAHGDVKDIKVIAGASDLHNYICKKEDFLATIPEESKLKELIKELQVKFVAVDLEDAPIEMANFVVAGNYYQLNETMAERVLRFKDAFSEKEYKLKNYTYINTFAPKEFVEYVDENLNEYIANIWLPLADAIDNLEDEKYLLELLNNDNIDRDNKIAVIEKTKTKITDLKTVHSHKIDQELLVANKALVSWENVIHYYEENTDDFDDILINFISDGGNSEELKKNKLDTSESNKVAANKIANAVISEQGIPDDAYSEIIDGILYYYNDLNFVDHLSIEKLRILVMKGKFGVTAKNFDRLKGKSGDIHILLLDKDPAKVVERLDEFKFSEDDIIKVINSTKFTSTQKNAVLHTLSDDIIIGNKDLLTSVGEASHSSDEIVLFSDVRKAILSTANISSVKKIGVYLRGEDDINKTEFFDIISTWASPFNEIQPNGKQTIINDSELYWRFVNTIFAKGYIYEPKKDKKGIRIRNLKTLKWD